MRMMKTIYQVSALLLVAMMLQACASKQVAVEPVTMKEKPIPMILDTDFGSSTHMALHSLRLYDQFVP